MIIPAEILLGYIFVWSLPLTIHIPEIKIQIVIRAVKLFWSS